MYCWAACPVDHQIGTVGEIGYAEEVAVLELGARDHGPGVSSPQAVANTRIRNTDGRMTTPS